MLMPLFKGMYQTVFCKTFSDILNYRKVLTKIQENLLNSPNFWE